MNGTRIKKIYFKDIAGTKPKQGYSHQKDTKRPENTGLRGKNNKQEVLKMLTTQRDSNRIKI
jgi:hypothetical protein